MREHVVAASKAMRNGDWRKASNYIINEKMNGKVRPQPPLARSLISSLRSGTFSTTPTLCERC